MVGLELSNLLMKNVKVGNTNAGYVYVIVESLRFVIVINY